MKKYFLFIDQYGQVIYARTIKELREKHGGGRVSKMYRDRGNEVIHVGYVIGQSWYTRYAPVEKVA